MREKFAFEAEFFWSWHGNAGRLIAAIITNIRPIVRFTAMFKERKERV